MEPDTILEGVEFALQHNMVIQTGDTHLLMRGNKVMGELTVDAVM